MDVSRDDRGEAWFKDLICIEQNKLVNTQANNPIQIATILLPKFKIFTLTVIDPIYWLLLDIFSLLKITF